MNCSRIWRAFLQRRKPLGHSPTFPPQLEQLRLVPAVRESPHLVIVEDEPHIYAARGQSIQMSSPADSAYLATSSQNGYDSVASR